jgi:hypothetical protein
VTVHVFYNPDLVGQLATCGITQRRQLVPGAPTPGFVLEGRRVPPRGREAVTNVVAVHGQVTITGPRQQLAGRPTQLALPATAAAPGPQSALERRVFEPGREAGDGLTLAEECTRLRRSNQLLTDEVARLRAEVERLTGVGTSRQPRGQDLDDAVTRFSLLELDL